MAKVGGEKGGWLGKLWRTVKNDLNPQYNEDRRNLLKTAAVIAAVVSPVGLEIYRLVTQKRAEDAKSPETILRERGLAAYLPFFAAGNELTHAFTTTPAYSGDDSFVASYWDPYQMLVYEASMRNDDIDSTLRWTNGDGGDEVDIQNRLKNGWAQTENRADWVERAKAKVKATEIKVDEGLAATPQDVETIRGYYMKLAELLPYHILIAPNILHIQAGGGEYQGVDDPTFGIRAEIAVESPLQPGPNGAPNNVESFYRSLLHELGHAEANWLPGKPYATLDAFVAYNTIETQQVNAVLQNYFSLPWEKAKVYKDNTPLVFYYDSDSAYDVDSMRQELNQVYGFHFAGDPKGATNSDKLNFLIWQVGNKRIQIMNKIARQEKLSEQENAFFTLSDNGNYINGVGDVNGLMQRAVDELHHYFRGPVQKAGLGLPGVINRPDQPDSFLTKANEKVQLARFKAYSTLSPEELADSKSCYIAIRKHLGLPPDTPDYNIMDMGPAGVG